VVLLLLLLLLPLLLPLPPLLLPLLLLLLQGQQLRPLLEHEAKHLRFSSAELADKL
jgi:hypothetical protein